MYNNREAIVDGTQLAADWTFSGLQKFGQGLLDKLRGLKLPHPLLEKVSRRGCFIFFYSDGRVKSRDARRRGLSRSIVFFGRGEGNSRAGASKPSACPRAGEHRGDPGDIGNAQARGPRVPVQRRVPVVHRQGRRDILGVRPGEAGRRPGDRGDTGPAEGPGASGTRA